MGRLALLFATLLASGCCGGGGSDRLTHVDIDDERGGLRQKLRFGDRINDFPLNAFFVAYRLGGPGPGKLTTIPMLELYDDSGQRLSLARFTANNDGGCAVAEIYEPDEQELVLGKIYTLVHRAKASPGDIDDSGEREGSLEGLVTSFDGERALTTSIRPVEATSYPTGRGGAGGTGGNRGGGGDGVGGAGG